MGVNKSKEENYKERNSNDVTLMITKDRNNRITQNKIINMKLITYNNHSTKLYARNRPETEEKAEEAYRGEEKEIGNKTSGEKGRNGNRNIETERRNVQGNGKKMILVQTDTGIQRGAQIMSPRNRVQELRPR